MMLEFYRGTYVIHESLILSLRTSTTMLRQYYNSNIIVSRYQSRDKVGSNGRLPAANTLELGLFDHSKSLPTSSLDRNHGSPYHTTINLEHISKVPHVGYSCTLLNHFFVATPTLMSTPPSAPSVL